MPTQRSPGRARSILQGLPDICVLTATEVPIADRSTIYALNALSCPRTRYSIPQQSGLRADTVAILANVSQAPVYLVTPTETSVLAGRCAVVLNWLGELIWLPSESDPLGRGYQGFWWEEVYYAFDAGFLYRLFLVEPAPDPEEQGDDDDDSGHGNGDDGDHGDHGDHGNGGNGGNG